jgi:hypothetical protein
MDALRARIQSMPLPQRLAKLDEIINFFRSNNSPKHADAFVELKNCYPSFPFFKDEEAFRLYLAWCRIVQLPIHGAFAHILQQG